MISSSYLSIQLPDLARRLATVLQDSLHLPVRPLVAMYSYTVI